MATEMMKSVQGMVKLPELYCCGVCHLPRAARNEQLWRSIAMRNSAILAENSSNVQYHFSFSPNFHNAASKSGMNPLLQRPNLFASRVFYSALVVLAAITLWLNGHGVHRNTAEASADSPAFGDYRSESPGHE